MGLRRLALAFAVLLTAALPAAAASRGGNGGEGIAIRGVAYDAATGMVEVRMRWHRQELRRGGGDAGHVLLWAGADSDAPTLLRSEAIALGRDHRTRHPFRLTPREQALLESGGARVATIHKHDDDGGLFDRAYVAVATLPPVSVTPPSGASSRSDAAAADADCSVVAPGLYLEGCDFSGMDLSHMDLNGMDLAYTNLSYANLSYTNLYRARLTSANVAYANLSHADLTRADLSFATLRGANVTGAAMAATFCRTTMPDGTTNNANCPN